MLCSEELVRLELFQVLPPDRLEWVCHRTELIELSANQVLVHEGKPALGFLLLMEGQIGLTRKSDGIEMPIGHHDSPLSWVKSPSSQANPLRSR